MVSSPSLVQHFVYYGIWIGCCVAAVGPFVGFRPRRLEAVKAATPNMSQPATAPTVPE